jgi:hypothetical protein
MLALAACGSGSQVGTAVDVPAVSSDDSVPNAAPQVSPLSAITWLAEGLAWSDRDGDGVEDNYDAWPDQQPILSDPLSSSSLTIERLWTEIDGNVVDSTAVEGYPLHLAVKGLPASSANATWIVFQTSGGLRASKASLESDGTLLVEPRQDALGVHVLAGALRGMDHPVSSLRLGQPVLFDTGSALAADTQVTLKGRNLDAVESVRLADDELRIVTASSKSITLQLPRTGTDNRLVASSAAGPSNTLAIDLRQNVELRLSSDLPLAQQQQLRVRLAGTEYRLSHASPGTANMPATQPSVLSFDIVAGDAVQSYRNLRAVVWPGDEVVEVSARSTLLARMVHIRHLLPDAVGNDWQAIRAAVSRVFLSQAAQEYVAALDEHVAGRAGSPSETLLTRAIDAYREIARDSAPDSGLKSSAVAAAAPKTSKGHALDGVVASTMTFIGQELDNKSDPDEEAGYAYPEQVADQVFGEDYSQVIILPHEEPDTLKKIFRLFSGCSFSPDESGWYTVAQEDLDPWNWVWRSDLCIQVGGLTFISAAVVKPGFDPPQPIFDAMDEVPPDGSNRPIQNVRRHARADFLDAGHQLGAGGYYLRTDSGKPLCHMETCYIEVITSGYGAYKNVALTDNQKALVDILRTRMWIEGFIPWMLSIAGVLPTDPVRTCLRNNLLQDGTLKTAVADFSKYIRSKRDKSGFELIDAINTGLDTIIGPWARKYVRSQLGNQFIDCVAGVDPASEIQAAIEAKLLERSGLSTFVEILEHVKNVGSAVFTPEKFVFKVQYRAEIKNVSLQTIDLYDDSRNLRIDGDWLILTDPNSANPCAGEGYCPELVFTDRLGATESLALNESHIVTPASGCGLACTSLSIPISELQGLQNLVGGPLRVELAYTDPSYVSYPENKLRVPVPGNGMRLKTRAKIYSVHPPLIKPGEEILVKGTGFKSYGTSPVFRLSYQGDMGEGILLTRKGGGDADAEARLSVPAILPQPLAPAYTVRVIPGLDAPEEDLEDLLSETPLLITDQDLQLVVVGDYGIVKDDQIRVEFLNANGQIVSAIDPIRTLSFDLPLDGPTPTSEKIYAYGQSWDDISTGQDGRLLYVEAPIKRVRIRCDVPGSNKACTWGIRSMREKLCYVAGVKPKSAMSHTVAQSGERVYYLADANATSCVGVVPLP